MIKDQLFLFLLIISLYIKQFIFLLSFKQINFKKMLVILQTLQDWLFIIKKSFLIFDYINFAIVKRVKKIYICVLVIYSLCTITIFASINNIEISSK